MNDSIRKWLLKKLDGVCRYQCEGFALKYLVANENAAGLVVTRDNCIVHNVHILLKTKDACGLAVAPWVRNCDIRGLIVEGVDLNGKCIPVQAEDYAKHVQEAP